MTKDRVGFIGLGRMGGPMALRIHDAGFPVIVLDVVDAALEPFRSRGIEIATSPRNMADRCDIVFACLPSPEASLEVALGDNGIIHGSAVRVYVENSTIGPEVMEMIAKDLEPSGIAFLDAPISGGIPGAEQGTLSTIVAGRADALERTRPIISAFASNIFHVAPKPGPAQIAKLINNMLSSTGAVAAYEGFVFGVKAGLDADALLSFINASTGRNVATMEKFPKQILTRKFGGKIQTGVKDLGLYLDQAERHGIEPYIAPQVLQVYLDAIENGFDRETTRIIEYLEQKAGGVVVRGKGAEPAVPGRRENV